MPHDGEYAYKYDDKADIYCYPNSDVLINKFDIRDKNALNTAERQITALKIAEFEKNPIKGNYDFKYLTASYFLIFMTGRVRFVTAIF